MSSVKKFPEVENFIRFSRTYSVEKFTWFTSILYRCQIDVNTKVYSTKIDQNLTISFNPYLVQTIMDNNSKEIALQKISFFWIHEISHILREHYERGKEKSIIDDSAINPYAWHIACDAEINDGEWRDIMLPTIFPQWHPYLLKCHRGHIAEYYYDKINQPLTHTKEQTCTWDGETSFTQEDIYPNFSNTETNESLKEIHAIDLELLRKQVANDIKKNIGSISGNWNRWADKKLESKTDWRKILKHKAKIITRIVSGNRVDYSYQKPSRRQSIMHPIYTPSLVGSESNDKISIIIDTSGSMTSKQLGQAAAEVCKVFETMRAKLEIIPCDSTVFKSFEIKNKRDYKKLYSLPGGGGTDMNAGINSVLSKAEKPIFILVLTDGYTPYPPKKLEVPVIFGIFSFSKQENIPLPPNPPWGKDTIVKIEIEAND